MNLSHLLIAGTSLISAVPVVGQIRPQPGMEGPRLQTVEYRAGQVVQLETAQGYQLSVEFAPDEHIESVAVGDSGAWQVTPNRRGDHLFVKLVQGEAITNMTVVTDVRTYLFDLVPLSSAAPDMAYVVRFQYPQPLQGVVPMGGAPGMPGVPGASAQVIIKGVYKLSGAKSLRPSAMGDDGVHTYIEWPGDMTLPAVYALDERGRETLVNGMMRNAIFVVDSVAQRFVFRIDRQTARAEREMSRENVR